MDTAIRVQILDEADRISHRINTLGKGINTIIRVNSRGDLVRQLVKEKENSDLKPVKLRLKNDLVSYPARAEGLVNMHSNI